MLEADPTRGARRSGTRDHRRRLYCSAVALMVREHARPLTLAEVARHSLTSTRHMQRVLADEGTSFRRMLLQVRMSHAARLLRTEAAVGEVARAVGYLELARFSKAFRCYYGCSPSTWRKGHR